MLLQNHQIISIDSKRWNRFEINELLFDCRFLDTILCITISKQLVSLCILFSMFD